MVVKINALDAYCMRSSILHTMHACRWCKYVTFPKRPCVRYGHGLARAA